MMDTLRGILGDNADDKIQNAMNMLKNSGFVIDTQNTKKTGNISEQIESDIKTDSFAQNSTSNNSGNKPFPNTVTPEGLEFLNQIRGIVNQMSNTNDTRSDLLRSLRPFMRTPRQRTIDRAIRIMNIGRFSGLFGK